MNLQETDLNRKGHVIRKLMYDNRIAPGDVAQLSSSEKVNLIEKKIRDIMLILGLDLEDDSLSNTPARVAKMYVHETFSGLLPENEPRIALFENKYNYTEMLVEKNIPLFSVCEHHLVPITGKAHVAYISAGKVIGLSKLNRVVNYFARRPQVQERLTVQVAEYLKSVLGTENVAVIIDAAHLCVSSRGVNHDGCVTTTSSYHGKFIDNALRNELNNHLNR